MLGISIRSLAATILLVVILVSPFGCGGSAPDGPKPGEKMTKTEAPRGANKKAGNKDSQILNVDPKAP